MKTIDCSAVVGAALLLLMAIGQNSVTAVEVIQANLYGELDETCEGTILVKENSGAVGSCQYSGGVSKYYTSCSSYDSYDSPDCSGDPSETIPVETSCEPFSSDAYRADVCVTKPDHKVGRFQQGSACSDGGDVLDLYIDEVFVLDECLPYDYSTTFESYMYTLNDGAVTYTTFLDNVDCTGPSESFTVEVGSCVESEGEPIDRLRRRLQVTIARKIVAVVPGATLSTTPPPDTSSPTPPTSEPTTSPTEADDEDADNPGNGNNALAGSVNVFSLFTSMAGVLALMF